MSSTVTRRLTFTGLALLALLVLMWLISPWSLKLLAERSMPEGWTLQQLELRRPGINEVQVDKVVATTTLAGYAVTANIDAARIDYPGLYIDIGQAQVTVQAPDTAAGPGPGLAPLELPQLVLPAGLPPTLVHALSITGLPGMGGEVLELKALRFGGDQQARFELDTEVRKLPWLARPLPLNLAGGDGELRVELGAAELPLFVQLRQTLVAGQPDTRLSARVQLQGLDRGQLQQQLDTVGWPRLGNVSGTLEATLNDRQLVLRTLGGASLGLSAPPGDWPAELREIAGTRLDELGISLDHDLDTPLLATLELDDDFELIAETGAGQRTRLAGDGRLTLEQESSRLQVDFSDTDLELRELDPGLLEGSGQLAWLARTPGRTRLQLGQQSLHLQHIETRGTAAYLLKQGGLAQLSSTGTASLEQLRLPALGVDMNRSDISWAELDLITLNGKLKLDSHSLSVPLGEDATAPPSHFDSLLLDLALRNGSAVNGKGVLQFQPGIELGFALQGDISSGRFTATLEPATLGPDSPQAMLTQLGFHWPALLVLTAGNLELSGALVLDTDTSGMLNVRGLEFSALVAESGLDGLAFELEARLADTLTASGALSADRFELAAGLDLTSLALQLNLGDELLLRDIQGQLLEGRLDISQARISGRQLEPTTLNWTGLDLAGLLRFIDVGGLEGSGTLDATLPLQSKSGGIAVSGGTFTATGPGYLRYSSGAPAGNIGLQALENFRYDELSGNVDYDPDGPYAIGVDLLGRNPDLYGGHPIRFRLNINGELPALFKSLFLTGSFEEALLEQINSGELAPQP